MRRDTTNLREDASMRTRLIVGLTVMSVWVLGGQMLAAQDAHGATAGFGICDARRRRPASSSSPSARSGCIRAMLIRPRAWSASP